MSRISRIVVLVTALASLFGVMSATAGAVTWHNTGDTAFTATTGPGTLSATGVELRCPSGTGTGSLGAGPFLTHTLTVSGTVHYNGCLISGIATTVSCGYSLTGTTWTGPTTHGVTHGVADVTCDLTQFNTKICHIEGTTTGSYFNPTHNLTRGRLTVNTSTSLRLTSPAAGVNCPLGNNDAAHLTEGTYTVTTATGGPVAPHTGPIITRTA